MASKKVNVVSHSHANVLKRDNRRFNKYVVPTEIETIVEEVTLDKGVKVTNSYKVTTKLGEKYKGIKWYDFSIDSLSAAGALGTLSPSSLEGNVFNSADNISATIEKLESAAAVQENNNNEVKTEE